MMKQCHAVKPRCNGRRSRGFTVIEVMVTVAVVSVGVLGAMATQAKALKNTYASQQRSIASSQAQDLVDRLWAGVCVHDTQYQDIASEWSDAHSQTSDSKVAMEDWNGTLTKTGDVYKITITWTDRQGTRQGESTAQSFEQYTSLPQVSCS